MKTKKKVTMQMIADEANVSKSLVSLALSDYKHVNVETKSLIMLKAMQLGYDFKKKLRRDIKFILVFSTLTYLNTSYWLEVITGLTSRLQELQADFEAVEFDKLAPPKEFLMDVIKKKCGGMMIVASCDDEALEILAKPQLPIVLLDTHRTHTTKFDRVVTSNYFSSYEAARYLYEKGHRRIAFAGSPAASIAFRQRFNGFCDFFKEEGFGSSLELLIEPGDDEYGTASFAQIKNSLTAENRPTAYFCANDPIALKLYDMAAEKGLSVPGDISIIGYDDIVSDHPFMKNLTTFSTDKRAMGATAAEVMVKRYEKPQTPPMLYEIPSVFTERSSVKDLNGKAD